MRSVLSCFLLLLACIPAYAGEPSATSLAGLMREAQLSDGFSARMNVAVIKADGRRMQPFKVAVIGQMTAARRRLLIRGIAPASVRNHYFAAETRAAGVIRAIAYTEQPTTEGAVMPALTPLFDSGMVIWDMLSPWWDWPEQTLGEAEQVAGHECTVVTSLAPAGDLPVHEVVSCIDRDAKLSLRTQLFDKRHRLMRSITVEHMMRMGSGAMAAKRMTITDTDNVRTEIEVYSGDENYLIGSETFFRLDALLPVIKPR